MGSKKSEVKQIAGTDARRVGREKMDGSEGAPGRIDQEKREQSRV
jgi:hypothetical protein